MTLFNYRVAREVEVHDRAVRMALAGRDPVAYFFACENAGVEPVDLELYQRGAFMSRVGSNGNVVSTDKNIRYRTLLRMSQGLRVDDISADPKTKKRILQETFPQKFGRGGEQDITDYTAVRIGTLYRNLIRDARRKVK